MTILKMWVIWAMAKKMWLTKLQARGQFLAPIIVEAIVIVFYKITRNTGMAFNPATTDFFELFCIGMLAFLFAIIYCGIREYQSGVKVVKLLNGKIAQSMYYLCIATYSYGCANIADRYIYTDPLVVIWLQARAKIINRRKAEATSHTYFQYHSRQYRGTDRANSWPI